MVNVLEGGRERNIRRLTRRPKKGLHKYDQIISEKNMRRSWSAKGKKRLHLYSKEDNITLLGKESFSFACPRPTHTNLDQHGGGKTTEGGTELRCLEIDTVSLTTTKGGS